MRFQSINRQAVASNFLELPPNKAKEVFQIAQLSVNLLCQGGHVGGGCRSRFAAEGG